MKPDWKDAPEWANWLAMDCEGDWTWFESEPELGLARWRNVKGGKIKSADENDEWRETLEQRP